VGKTRGIVNPVLIRVNGKVELCSGHPRHYYAPLSLKYIQSAEQQRLGKPVALLDALDYSDTPSAQARRIVPLNPDVAVIQASSPGLDESLQLGTLLREAGIPTVAVGQQVSHAMYQPVPGWDRAFDIAIPGEPEQEVSLLLSRLDGPDSIGREAAYYSEMLQNRRPLMVEEPDRLPVPQFSLVELTRYRFPLPIPGVCADRWGYVLSSWGCQRHCLHCSGVTRKTPGGVWRARNPQMVADEVERLHEVGAQAICFEDDNLFHDPDHVARLCLEMAGRGRRLPWMAHARPDDLDERRVSHAAKAGAKLLKVGVESGSPRVIERLGKTAGGEGWIAAVRKSFGLLQRYGIGSVALFMLGMPDENVSDTLQSLRLACELRPTYVQVQIFCPYPDTRYYSLLQRERRRTIFGPQYHYSTPVWSPSNIPVKQLAGLQRSFYRRFYLRPSFAVHQARRLANGLKLGQAMGIFSWLLSRNGHNKLTRDNYVPKQLEQQGRQESLYVAAKLGEAADS